MRALMPDSGKSVRENATGTLRGEKGEGGGRPRRGGANGSKLKTKKVSNSLRKKKN